MGAITRWTEVRTVEIDISDSTTLSDPFDLASFAWGSVSTPGTLTQDGMGFQVTNTDDGASPPVPTNFSDLTDSTGATIADIVVAPDKTYTLPPELFNSKYARMIMDGAEAADRTFTFCFKG